MIPCIFLLLHNLFGSDAYLLRRHIHQESYLKNKHKNLTCLRIQHRDLDQEISKDWWKNSFLEQRIRVRVEEDFLVPKLTKVISLKQAIEV